VDRNKFDEMMAKPTPKAAELAEQDESPGGMQIGFDVVEVQRLSLQPDDVLMVTVKNDELSQASVDALRKQLQLIFQNNKVFVFAMGTNDDVQLSIVSEAQLPVASCDPVGYCSDCSCGKKEQATGGSDAG
jgi:hypothetical protein